MRLEFADQGGRSFDLLRLPLTDRVVETRCVSRHRRTTVRLLTRCPHQRRWVAESRFSFQPELLDLRPPIHLTGYFQSWRYFPTIGETLRTHLNTLDSPSQAYETLARSLLGQQGLTTVHVRRGDYLNAQQYHGMASDEYFAEALKRFHDSGSRLAVFTDDDTEWTPSWAEPYVPIIIRPRHLTDAREVLALMSKGDTMILSNSSFAWWSGWAGERPGQTVVAPRPWFADPALDTRDLLPRHWLTLDLRAA